MNLRVSLFLKKSVVIRVLLSIVVLAWPISGLRCYQCGEYTDGPGSITPCVNYTDDLHLKDCPPEANEQCVKYVNEASTVRACADDCREKRSDSWGTSVYCCSEDACNSASDDSVNVIAGAVAAAIAVCKGFRLLYFPAI